MTDAPYITHFAPEEAHYWDHETGMPTAMHFANALQVWCIAQNRAPITVGEAALAFNVAPALIRTAVEEHYWMFLDGEGDDQTIEHELE